MMQRGLYVDSKLVEELAVAAATQGGPGDFKDLLSRAVEALGLSLDDAAGLLGASRFTAERWLSGTSAPHALVQPSIFGALHKVAVEERLQFSVAQAE